MKTDELLVFLEIQKVTLEYCLPFMQNIPGVQEPDCSKILQSLIDFNHEIQQIIKEELE